MVLLGYFTREAREAADIDAAWRVATKEPSLAEPAGRSLGTTAIKSSPKGATTRPLPNSAPSLSQTSEPPSYFASLTRRASSLASSVGLTSFSDISFGTFGNGTLFEFSEVERQKAAAILNAAAASATAADSTSSSAESPIAAATTGLIQPAVLFRGVTGSQYEGTNRSEEPVARGRSSSVWSSTASVSSVIQRSRNVNRSDMIW